MNKLWILMLCILTLLLPYPAQAHPDVDGYDTLLQKLETSESTVRIILEVRLQKDIIEQLGHVNATNEAVAILLTEATANGVQNAKRIGETQFIVAEFTKTELDKTLASGTVIRVQFDAAELPTLDTVLPIISAQQAHNEGASGAGTSVVVLDTGVEANHQFLGGRVTVEACFSSNTPNANSACPNNQETQFGAGAAAPCALQNCDHGTHVAGIVAGRVPGFTGVAPDASIIAIQVFSNFNDGVPRTYVSDQLAALNHVRLALSNQHWISAINMSLGGGEYTTCPNDVRATEIGLLRSLGIATVIASGNDDFVDTVGAPGCIPNAVTVGATHDNDQVASFSNSGGAVDLMAPGVSVVSSIINNRFGPKNGTSMATPVVAGSFAALQSYRVSTVNDLETILVSTGQQVPLLNPNRSRPRVNLGNAAELLDSTRPSDAFVWMRDTWSDTGREPDPATRNQGVSQSPAIWIRNQDECITNKYQHQNPEFGQVNYACVEILNSGNSSEQGTLQIFVAKANLNNTGSWGLINSINVVATASGSTLVSVPWANLPSAGHYCLIARWVPTGGDLTLKLPGGIHSAVRNSNDLSWRNVNIVSSNRPTSSAISYEVDQNGRVNLVVEIERLNSTDADAIGELIIELGGDPEDLNSEPTSRYYKHDNRFISIPLKPGVYYIPNIVRDSDKPMVDRLEFRPKDRDSEDTGLLLKVTLRHTDDVDADKQGLVRHGPAVTYYLDADSTTE